MANKDKQLKKKARKEMAEAAMREREQKKQPL